MTIIADRVKIFVEDYASSKLSQSDYNRKYNELKAKYDEASTKYQELVKLKEHRILQSKAINLFIKSLEEKPLVLDEWDNSCWALFVDKAIVHKDKSITFNFNNGTNIKIETL